MQHFMPWQAFILAASLLLAPLPAWAETNLQQLLKLGSDALKTGNSLLATQKYQEAVSQNPDSHQAWYRLAEAQYKSKNYNDAIKSVSKALKLAPDQPALLAKYHTGRAWACYQAGLNGQAVIDMERAVELAPNNRQYQNWLNGARQKEQQKGPGPGLSSVLGYEEMQRSSGSSAQESESRQDEERQPFGEDSQDRASQDSQDRERNQDEASSQERSQEENPRENSSAEREETASGQPEDISPRCRKSYFVCMAGCADIQSADSRGICENACRSAAKACQ